MTSSDTSTQLLREGDVLRDTYVVERRLGQGAFAEVYRVVHPFHGRQAMKVFKRQSNSLTEAREMLNEARLLTQFKHPNIVSVYDVNTIQCADGGTHPFFTMDYIAMGTLEDYWLSFVNSLMPVDGVVDLMRQACRGLSVAHEQNPPLVHRDIKPQNLLVGYDNTGLRLRVSDFGLAKEVNPLTLLVTAHGTAMFKPPEVFRDPKADSCQGDIWGLGCVMYLLLTDRLPYGKLSMAELRRGDFARDDLAPPSSYNPNIDSVLDAIVRRALHPKAAGRYPNARAMGRELEAWSPAGSRKSPDSEYFATSKEALSPQASDIDEAELQAMVAEAMRLAKNVTRLSEAADLMEEAVRKSPELRDQFEFQIRLWRNGVAL